MKYIISSLLLPFLLSVFSLPTTANEKSDRVRFYCDLQNREQPTTLATVKGQEKLYVLIQWKYPAPKGMTKAERCKIVSNRFQKTWDRGGGFRIVSGTAPNGLGFICALRNNSETCTKSDWLFTLKNIKEANEVMYSLTGTLAGNIRKPIEQSEEPQTFDLGAWIDAQSQSKTGDRAN